MPLGHAKHTVRDVEPGGCVGTHACRAAGEKVITHMRRVLLPGNGEMGATGDEVMSEEAQRGLVALCDV
jgi:hypothetical protein